MPFQEDVDAWSNEQRMPKTKGMTPEQSNNAATYSMPPKASTSTKPTATAEPQPTKPHNSYRYIKNPVSSYNKFNNLFEKTI